MTKQWARSVAVLPLLMATGGVCSADERNDPAAIDPRPLSAATSAVDPIPAVTSRSLDLVGRTTAETDGRRTLAAFPKNLLRGVVGVVEPGNLRPLLFGAGLAASGRLLDEEGQELLRDRCAVCGRTGATVGGLAVAPVVGGLFVAGRLAPHGAFRAASYDFAQALAVDAIWSSALKVSLHRLRPDHSNRYSLPSGHASAAFSLATVADRHFGRKAGIPAYALASYIGLTRVERNKHYLSDVLAGATLGVIVGRTVIQADEPRRGRHRTLSIAPTADASGGGVGLGLSASW